MKHLLIFNFTKSVIRFGMLIHELLPLSKISHRYLFIWVAVEWISKWLTSIMNIFHKSKSLIVLLHYVCLIQYLSVMVYGSLNMDQHSSIFVIYLWSILTDLRLKWSLTRYHRLILWSCLVFTLFSVDHRAACTFLGMPEGAYHERIFRLFPSLRVCHLLFDRKGCDTIQSLLFTTPNRSLVPIQSNLSNLRSLTLRYCLPEFLPHLFEHLPQLEQLSCHLYNMSLCSLEQHSPEHGYDKYVSLLDMMYLNCWSHCKNVW